MQSTRQKFQPQLGYFIVKNKKFDTESTEGRYAATIRCDSVPGQRQPASIIIRLLIKLSYDHTCQLGTGVPSSCWLAAALVQTSLARANLIYISFYFCRC